MNKKEIIELAATDSERIRKLIKSIPDLKPLRRASFQEDLYEEARGLVEPEYEVTFSYYNKESESTEDKTLLLHGEDHTEILRKLGYRQIRILTENPTGNYELISNLRKQS